MRKIKNIEDRFFFDFKALLAGILSISLLFSITYFTYPFLEDYYGYNDDNQNEIQAGWDFSSSSSLQLSINNHLPQLISLVISAEQITKPKLSINDSWFHLPIPLFTLEIDNFSFKKINPNIDQEFVDIQNINWDQTNWTFEYSICCNSIDRSIMFENNFDFGFIEIIQESFDREIENLENYTNITENYFSIRDNLLSKNGSRYWQIQYSFQDGNFLDIEIIGDFIIFRLLFFEKLLKIGNDYLFSFSSNYTIKSFFGHIKDEGLINHIEIINNVLDQLVTS